MSSRAHRHQLGPIVEDNDDQNANVHPPTPAHTIWKLDLYLLLSTSQESPSQAAARWKHLLINTRIGRCFICQCQHLRSGSWICICYFLPARRLPGSRQAEASSNQHPNREMIHLPTPAPTIWKLDLYLLLSTCQVHPRQPPGGSIL